MLFLLLLLSNLLSSTATATTITLSGSEWRHNLFKEGVHFNDPEKSLSYEDILTLTTEEALADGERLNPTGRRYWTRATIRNVDAPQELDIRVSTTQMSDIRFYVFKDGELVSESHQGLIAWSQKPMVDFDPSFNFPLHLARGEAITLIIRFEAKRFHRQFTTELLPARQVIYENNVRIVFIIFILGMIVVLALYNAIIGIAMRRIAYLWYALHASSYVLIFLFLFGYMAKIFSITDENFHYYQLSSNGALIAGLMFIYYFFELKSLAPRIGRFYRVYAGIIAAQMFIAIGFDLYTPHKLLAIQQGLHGPLIFFTAIMALRRGLTAAWFVVMGWFFISLAIVWGIFVQFGLLPSLTMVREAILATVGLDMMLLSLAMAYQFRRLEKEQMALRKKEEIQDRFLATLSHEVRTPLSSIITLVSSARDRLGKHPEGKTLEEVQYSGDALLSMVDNLLLFTQSKRSVVNAQQHPFNPRILFKSVVTLFTERAQSNRVTVSVKISPQVPDNLLGDEVLLRQTIINLLGNAIKYTRDGSVALTVNPSHVHPDHCELIIIISDTGKGIPEIEQKRIFDQFYQVEKKRTKGSAGMGLYIVASLVNVLGGKLHLSSAVGEGTTITLTLPFGIALAQVDAAFDESVTDYLAGTSLLLVEDDPILCQLIDEILSPLGTELFTAGTAHEAIQLLGEHSPDFILTDLHLPDLSGAKLVRQFGAHIEESEKSPPLIVMTASTNPQLHAELADEAIAGTLIKPITASTLIATLVAHCGETQHSLSAHSQTAHSSSALDNALIDAHRSALGDSVFAAFIAQYKTSMHGYLKELAAAIGRKESESIVSLAHKIVGISASLGLRHVSALANQLENNKNTFSDEALIALHRQLVQANSESILLIGSMTASPSA